MKKILFGLCLLAFSTFSSTALADTDYQSTKDIIEKSCLGTLYSGSFFKGTSCSGAKTEIYYVGDKEVTKVEFESKQKIFNEKGDICKETINSKPDERMKRISYSCVKGEYGKYYIDGKLVTYGNFIAMALATAFTQTTQAENKQILVKLNKEKKLLKTITTFKRALKASNKNTFSFPVVGSPCVAGGGVRMNGTGYKNAVCEGGKIKSLEYILNNEPVSFETYLKVAYKNSKDANKKAIAYYKKQK